MSTTTLSRPTVHLIELGGAEVGAVTEHHEDDQGRFLAIYSPASPSAAVVLGWHPSLSMARESLLAVAALAGVR